MWTFTTDLDAYARAAEPFLLTDPVRNTVPLSVLANLRAGMPAEGARFGWWTTGGPPAFDEGASSPGGQVGAAAFRTPPRQVVLSVMPVEAVAPLMKGFPDEIPGVVGPAELVEAAVEALGRSGTARAERLYRLGELTVPAVPGRGRLATSADAALLVEWNHAFFAEVGLPGGDVAELVDRRLAHRELFVWETDRPVSLAALSPSAGGVCRVGPVYTPPAARRRGYGAAITAYVSRLALAERCDQVVLFTDLANPTSNAVYQSIGYRPVADYAEMIFAD